MTLLSPEARGYLDRLADLLPPAEAARVRREVEALILDRAEAEGAAGVPGEEAERRAVRHLGPPEALADRLSEAPLVVGSATRRAFTRWLVVLTVGHLLLSILLTVARAEGPALPGLLFPLPRTPWSATLSSALAVVLIDVGLLFLLFALLGPRGASARLPALSLTPAWNRPDAARTLVLAALLALLAHPLRDVVFSVHQRGASHPFLAPDLLVLLPLLDLLLGLVALRALLTLLRRPKAALAADAAAAAAGIVLLVLASTRSELVRLPPHVLGAEAAQVLGDVVTRAFLVVFVGAALLLAVRLARRVLGLRRAWADGPPGGAGGP